MTLRSKIISTLVLAFAIIFGSFVNFYATNFILSDVSNLTYGFSNRPIYVLASLPALNLALIFVLLAIFLIRYIRHPERLRSLSRLYVIIFMVFSFIGLISSILSGLLVYKSFTSPNPFPGYLIIGIVLFSLFLLLGVLFFVFFYGRIALDEKKRKLKVGYVFYTIIFSVLTYYAFNRFGAFLWQPAYVDGPTFYLTWPFYFSLLLPIAMYLHTILYANSTIKKHTFGMVVAIVSIMVLFVITTLYTYFMAANNTRFISVISPAMGASRLLAKPIDFIMHTVIFGALGIYSVYHAITYHYRHKTKKEVTK